MSDAWDNRKKALEEDYFRRKEQETLEKMRAQMTAEQQASEAAASALQCPRCDGTLDEITFEDVQIDRCNKCGGVWLDSGELESLTKKENTGWLSRMWGSSGRE
jgi:ribosomal protein L37AE/L43A